ncbi:hypothetical protein HII36_09560 [Nonomuraea sp. NN258]|uniref:hypothetical protein n=1 Tax=Nonomuraea antri TaxID=2730852 RepID=UPI0015689BA8|nr:hypothetical protein [Nonomuraea antri]NRQ32083.1 hypothetical protein [Nonomuraea antri]
MTRPDWESLPHSVRDAVQAQVGPVLKAETVSGGIMPGLAARLHTESGEVFLKAIEARDPGAVLHERERWAGGHLPADIPAPRLLGSVTMDGWYATTWQYINDNARHADLSPGSDDLPRVLDTLALLGTQLTPAPAGATPVIDNVEALLNKGRHLLAKPGLDGRELYLAALDGWDAAELAGDTLVHYDLSESNLLVSGRCVWVVDWAFAAQGAEWLDAALFAPRLVQAGHTPEEVDELLRALPSWQHNRSKAISGLTALWTLFRLYKARYGPEEVRQARALAAQAGEAWLAYYLAKN